MQLPKLSERHRMQSIQNINPKTPIDTGKGDRERKSGKTEGAERSKRRQKYAMTSLLHAGLPPDSQAPQTPS